jgi:acetyltransferase-like isoleucine patch superfamily enzyme
MLIKKIIFYILLKVSTLYAKIKCASYGRGLRVNYPCFFSSKKHIGDDCHFNGMSVIGIGTLHIGSHFHSGSGILILTANHNYQSDTNLPYDEIDIERPVKIGECVWMGSKVIVLPGTEVGDGAVIQAGSVLHGKIPRCAVVGGNPAIIIKYRDSELFDKLVKEAKYVGYSSNF